MVSRKEGHFMQSWVLGAIAAGAAIVWGGISRPAMAGGEKATAEIKDRDGKSLGTAEIVGTAAGALVKVKLKGLAPGPHGFHFHEAGKCEGDFASAGGIYNPLGAVHGFLNEEGPMVGDLTNLFVDSSGSVEVELLSPFVTLSKEAEESIFDADGTSLVIFEKADDYTAEPEGGASARIACGAIAMAK
jgi:Cu-Zn family superoxide dismutase